MTQQRRYPTVGQIVDTTVLPDPTIPVPFERFASLKNSNDMLARAAFWCMYAAWVNDKSALSGEKTYNSTISVEARNDGHLIRSVSEELSIRDCFLVQKHDLEALQQQDVESQSQYQYQYHASGVLWWLWLFASFAFGVALTLMVSHG